MALQSSMCFAKTLSMLACCAALFTLQAKAAPSGLLTTGLIGYLKQFGYLPPPSPLHVAEMTTEESLSKAISRFQSYMGINVTGIPDDETIRVMEAPRCGLADRAAPGTSRRSKRYAILGNPWRQKVVTYRVSRYTNQLNRGDVDRVIANALAVWAEYVPIKFRPSSSGQTDMDISFGRRSHGDGNPFDGPGQTLAHAYAPRYGIGGDVHFDDDETWTIGGGHSTDLLQVKVHEIGHALGLDHSNVKTSIMFPTYRPNAAVRLDRDDIAGIEALYKGGNRGNRGNQGPVFDGFWWMNTNEIFPSRWPRFTFSG